MSLKIGDRVFHRGAGGNGIIVTINENFTRDKYGIKFLWHKYKKIELHNLNGFLNKPLGIWASEDKIVKTPLPTERRNQVTLMGAHSLDKLIRMVCEFPRRIYGNGIRINYGTFRNSTHRSKVINRNLISNKFEQCRKMIEAGVNVPKVSNIPFEGCIQKPFHSMGGKNIKEYNRGDFTYGYFQKKIHKMQEFRAHVFNWGDCVVPLIQEKTIEDPSQLTWNKKQGGKFHTIFQHTPYQARANGILIHNITSIAVNATKAIGYDIGGVDLALDSNGKLWVFEINTRMGLKEWSLCTYKTKFWELYNYEEV